MRVLLTQSTKTLFYNATMASSSSPLLCLKCNGEFKRNEKFLSCNGWCDQVFHPKCVKICDEIHKVIAEVNNILWCCDQCCTMKHFSMRQTVEYMRNAIGSWSKEMNMCLAEVREQKAAISTLNITVCEKFEDIDSSFKKIAENENLNRVLYADKLKLKKNEPVLVVKPKNEGQRSFVTKEDIKSSIDPTTLAISGIKHASRGGIIIECKNQASVSKLKEEAETKLGNRYKISVPKKRKPRIKIVGMSNKMTENEIETKIMAQNHFLESGKANLNVVHVAAIKNSKTPSYFAYVEVDAYSYDKLVQEGKVNIEKDRCKVFDAVTVTRCYKCNGFNHRARECKKELACPKWAGSHNISECKAENDEIKCVNCKDAVSKLKLKIDIHHEAWNTSCPVYKRMLGTESSKALRLYLDAYLTLFRGQGMELYWRENSICSTEEEYEQMVLGKASTIIFLATNYMQLFAKKHVDRGRFITNLSLYLQIRNDYESLNSDVEKGFCEDLTEGKFGHPTMHAVNSNPQIGKEIIKILKLRTSDLEKLKKCRSLIEKCGGFQYTKDKLNILKANILEELAKLEKNPALNEFLAKLMR